MNIGDNPQEYDVPEPVRSEPEPVIEEPAPVEESEPAPA